MIDSTLVVYRAAGYYRHCCICVKTPCGHNLQDRYYCPRHYERLVLDKRDV